MRSRNFLIAGAAIAALLAADLLVRWRQGASPTGEPRRADPAQLPASAALAARTSPEPPAGEAELPFTAEGSAEARNAVIAAGEMVYLAAMFQESDSLVRRWDPSRVSGLRIAYVTDEPPEWTADHRDIVRQALGEWERLGPGIRFLEVLDTTGADIVIRWIPRFDIDRAGQADLTWDGTGRIKRADIKLAIISPGGRFLSSDKLRAIALHEVGHALGLPHSATAGDLMFPTADHPVLTARDTATFQLLYALPPTSIKWSAASSPSR